MKKNKRKPETKLSETESFVEYERRRYSREWEITSNHYAENGNYAWMATEFGVTGTVLEIGCGNGNSTIALAKVGNKVIAIEENTACLRRAKQNIETAGFSVEVLMRGKFQPRSHRVHSISYEKIKEPDIEYDVLLIEGNVLKDQSLLAFLKEKAPFDGIACWLIGTHSSMIFNTCIDSSTIRIPSDYRLSVQNLIYEIADTLLRPSGILQVVDRTETPHTQEILDDFFDAHKDQASVTSLVPAKISHIPYSEPAHKDATEMIMTIPLNGSVENITGISMVSVISIKPAT